MEYLCFVNGRNQSEVVKIFEGEMYEIDRLTTSFIDSDAIRKKYKTQFAEFQAKYPHAKNGAVRIFGDSVQNENGRRVLYKKHKVAFNQMIKDTHFLRWSSRKDLQGEKKDRLIYDTYILKGIADFHLELTRINQFLTSIKRDDRKESGLTGGGKRYYRFMRALLNRYEDYRKMFNKPSIDDIWKEHLACLEHSKLEKEAPGEQLILPDEFYETEVPVAESASTIESLIEEDDVDRIYYDEPPIFEEPIYDFFTGDYFERFYSQAFVDDELMIVGDLSLTGDQNKLNPWQEVTQVCYNGTMFTSDISNFTQSDLQTFNGAKIIIIYGEEDTKYLRATLINAIQNKAEVVLISDNPVLIAEYTKRFKNIVTILDSEDDKHLSAKKQLVSFFIEQYNSYKGYNK